MQVIYKYTCTSNDMLPMPVKHRALVNDDLEIEINADFSIPVVVETEALEWQVSPAASARCKPQELVKKSATDYVGEVCCGEFIQ